MIGPGARNTDPETSHEAAERSPSVRERDRERVLEALKAHPDGLTDFELADIVGRQQTSAGKRRGELRDMGLVEATEERRKSPSGSNAIVWRYVPAEQRKEPTPRKRRNTKPKQSEPVTGRLF